MRTILLASVICCAAACLGQQTQPGKHQVPELLAKLHSKDWTTRSTAFEDLRSDPVALRSKRVQAALVELLDRENQEGDANVRRAQDPNYKPPTETNADSEGRGEYYGQLVYTVDSFADWNDPHEVCILIRAGDLRLGQSSTEIAARATLAMPCLIEMSKSDLGINRAAAMPMLAEALAKAKNMIDSDTAGRARQTIVTSLHDVDVAVRARTVSALEDFGAPEMIPSLQEVVRSDPAFEPSPEGKNQVFPIRESAANAIAAIQKRQGQN